MTIKKIDKIVTGTTPQKEDAVWAEVLSHRNKLLANSDWTQLTDSGLTPESVATWATWRLQLKQITRANYSNRDAAEKHIDILRRRTPFNNYTTTISASPAADHFNDINEYRVRVIKYMDEMFNTKLSAGFLDNPILVEEQFREALDYMAGIGKSFPILSVTAELYNQPLHLVADEFIARKTNAVKRAANLRQKYHYFQNLVNVASDDVQLERIQAEIKQWILTST